MKLPGDRTNKIPKTELSRIDDLLKITQSINPTERAEAISKLLIHSRQGHSHFKAVLD